MSELRTRPELARRVSQIDVRNVHDVHVILDGDFIILQIPGFLASFVLNFFQLGLLDQAR